MRKTFEIYHSKNIYDLIEVEIIMFEDFCKVLEKLNLGHLATEQHLSKLLEMLDMLGAIKFDKGLNKEVIVL